MTDLALVYDADTMSIDLALDYYRGDDKRPAELQILSADGLVSRAYYGSYVVASDDASRMVTFAPHFDSSEVAIGEAYAYDRLDTGLYGNEQQLVAPDVTIDDHYALHGVMAASGEWLFIAAPQWRGSVTNGGAVMVFRHDGAAWQYVTRLELPAPEAEAQLSWALACSGDGGVLVATTPFAAAGGVRRGAGHIWERDGGTYVYTATLMASAGSDDDQLGYAAACSGDGGVVYLGARIADDSGRVFRFVKSGTWPATETDSFTGSDTEADDRYGAYAVLSGTWTGRTIVTDDDGANVWVGAARWRDAALQRVGAVYWVAEVAGSMVEQQRIHPATPLGDLQWYGWCLSYHNGVLAAGVQGYDTPSWDVGAVVLFQQTGGQFSETHLIQAATAEPYTYYGFDAWLAGNLLLIGATDYNGGRGAVYVVDRATGEFGAGAQAAQLRIDDGLETAIMVSLFSDRRASDSDTLPWRSGDRRGWWGDTFRERELGSHLWWLSREPQRSDVLVSAVEYAREALAWLVDDGVADSVEVDAEYVRRGVIGLWVDVTRPDQPPVRYQFNTFWKGL